MAVIAGRFDQERGYWTWVLISEWRERITPLRLELHGRVVGVRGRSYSFRELDPPRWWDR